MRKGAVADDPKHEGGGASGVAEDLEDGDVVGAGLDEKIRGELVQAGGVVVVHAGFGPAGDVSSGERGRVRIEDVKMVDAVLNGVTIGCFRGYIVPDLR